MVLVFNIFGYVVFGSKVEGFVDFMVMCEIILVMILGKVYFMDLSYVEFMFGLLFFFLFVIVI